MKKIYGVVAAVALVIAMAGAAVAGTTPSAVAASATVVAVCSAGGSPAIGFGSLDAVADAGGAAAVITAPTIYCTNGASITVTDDVGVNEAVPGSAPARLKSGANYIPYSYLYTGVLTGAGMATSIGGAGNLNITASIAAGALDNAPAGAYTDTLTLTIAY